jgi:GNAT superfamily N-acetyltransferase
MITRITAADRPRWTELWAGYLTFYKTTLPQAVYDATWARLRADGPIHGFLYRHEGRAMGLVHYLYHAHAWSLQPACYLQDLFVDPALRGTGAGRALIEAVAQAAQDDGASRLYWTTQTDNEVGRRLYDRLAKHNGFIKYDYTLPPGPPSR